MDKIYFLGTIGTGKTDRCDYLVHILKNLSNTKQQSEPKVDSQ